MIRFCSSQSVHLHSYFCKCFRQAFSCVISCPLALLALGITGRALLYRVGVISTSPTCVDFCTLTRSAVRSHFLTEALFQMDWSPQSLLLLPNFCYMVNKFLCFCQCLFWFHLESFGKLLVVYTDDGVVLEHFTPHIAKFVIVIWYSLVMKCPTVSSASWLTRLKLACLKMAFFEL